MTLWQFAACVDGYNRANVVEGGGGVEHPSVDEFLAAKRAHGDL